MSLDRSNGRVRGRLSRRRLVRVESAGDCTGDCTDVPGTSAAPEFPSEGIRVRSALSALPVVVNGVAAAIGGVAVVTLGGVSLPEADNKIMAT
jgi:hypothetical protein